MLVISIMIILIGLVFIIQDLKHILKEEPVSKFILKGIGFMICGFVMNILLGIIL